MKAATPFNFNVELFHCTPEKEIQPGFCEY